MTNDDWIQHVDTSRLEQVLPIHTLVEHRGIWIEFIAVEIRQFGGVVTLRVVDESSRDDEPADFVVPDVELRSDSGQVFEVSVVSNDFASLASVRHRAVFRPRPPSGSTIRVVVADFQFGRSVAELGPWESTEVRVG